jgi:hypothetical protein
MSPDPGPVRRAHCVTLVLVLSLAATGAHTATTSAFALNSAYRPPAIGQVPAPPGEDPAFEAALSALPAAVSQITPVAYARVHHGPIDSNLLMGGNRGTLHAERPVSVGNLLKFFRPMFRLPKSQFEFRREFWALVPVLAWLLLPLLIWPIARAVWRLVRRVPFGWSI